MKNAFTVLGAMPSDDAERLRELYEEKQLFVDDDKEISVAYTELTNIKKRIIHEIKYLSKDYFKEFDSIFLDNNEDEQEMVVEDIVSSIITVGKWFDNDSSELFNEINSNREKAGFSVVGDIEIIYDSISLLKEECISAIKKYFDYWEQKDVVTLFNMLVEQDDYTSFFVDDLLIHYENLISETIKNKEKLCSSKFDLIENNSNNFINNGTIDEDFSNNITLFKRALTSWDKLVQPLQVNYQNRGAQHPGSFDFVQKLRNKVIDMCNKSQEDLTNLIQKIRYDISAKQKFIKKITNASEYIGLLIKILDILLQVFKEIDVVAERLRNDKKDFAGIQETIKKISAEVTPYVPSYNTGYSRPTSSSPSHGRSIDADSKKVIAWVIIGIIVFIMIVLGATKCSSNYSTSYAVTLDSQGGVGGTSIVYAYRYSSMPSAIAPTREGYDFVGYFTSKNGYGTKYYDSNMNSVRTWDKTTSYTLYADWTPKYGGIELTRGNFETYFNFSSSCSVSRYNSYSSGTATYTFSISPKSSFHYNSNSRNPNSITVKIGLDITASSKSYGTIPCEYIIEITLYKSNGYSYSGNRSYTAGIYENYWDDGIYSVDAIIYN